MKSIKAITLGTLAAALLFAAADGAAARPRFCSKIYKPVCAVTRDGHRQTFGNRCEAERAHARILYNGRCRYRHR
ncbi:MAG TPA: Kazal-type serine protease inhibitor [Rhizomicrobium sp.]